MTVSVQNVKDLLDISASAGLTTDTFQANIDRSKRFVDDVKDPLANANQVDDAIASMAAWLSYGAYTEGISQELGNISIADRIKLQHFRKVAEFFINRISTESVDLDIDNIHEDNLIGIDPSVTRMTTTDRYAT